MSKPCEYCGFDMPDGVDKKTRSQRSRHFAACPARPHQARPLSEVERLRHNNSVLTDALWKACGDDEAIVNSTIESQGELL